MRNSLHKTSLLAAVFLAASTYPAAFSAAGPNQVRAQLSTHTSKQFIDIAMVPPHKLIGENMTMAAAEAANILKVAPLVERLRQATSTEGQQPAKRDSQIRLLILYRILSASQEVRKAVAAIDKDLAESYAILQSLTSKRDATINTINTVNFTQGGILGVLGKSGALCGYPPQSNVKLITACAIGTGLSSINLLTPRLWRKHITESPNILAQFLQPGYSPNDADRSYLWAFFNSPIPESTWTYPRKEVLLKHWKDFLGFDASNKYSVQRVSALPDGAQPMSESIKTVSDRLALLHDLKSHIEEFDISLNELSNSIETR